MGRDGYQTYHSDHFIMYVNVNSPSTLETNITLYVKRISIKVK